MNSQLLFAIFSLATFSFLNAQQVITSPNEALPLRRMGFVDYADSKEGINTLIVVGSFCGRKNNPIEVDLHEIKSSGDIESLSAISMSSWIKKTKKKSCTPEMEEAVTSTLQQVKRAYLNRFGYRNYILFDFKQTRVIVTRGESKYPVDGFTERIDSISYPTLFNEGLDEFTYLQKEIEAASKKWTKKKGTMNVYFNVHSSPTHLFINETEFKIGSLWEFLVKHEVGYQRSHWYFDTCFADRFRLAYQNSETQGFNLLEKLSPRRVIGVASALDQKAQWVAFNGSWYSAYSLAFGALARATEKVDARERTLNHFFFYAKKWLEYFTDNSQSSGYLIQPIELAREDVLSWFPAQ